MGLQVIGAGLGRTGTLSLKTALEQLGFGPCHHMIEVFAAPERQVPLWTRAAQGEPTDWDAVYEGFAATVDWPGCHFFAELAQRYPDARVILTRRDPQRWYESISETILRFMDEGGLNAPEPDPRHPMHFSGLIVCRQFLGNDLSRENVIAAYEAHVERVRASIAPGRLLEFEVAQGWEPLCDFLGVAVPDAPFPRTNSREEFWQHLADGGAGGGGGTGT